MKEIQCADFQSAVSRFLLRHQSVLDILSKHQEAAARCNRAVIKAVTSCGCVEIQAVKPELPPDAGLDDLRRMLSSHVEGHICDNCRETLIQEMGRDIFYLTALCNVFDISLQEVLRQEAGKLETLGKYNLT
jgi:hypothetical protein